jgi:hypothetical protein
LAAVFLLLLLPLRAPAITGTVYEIVVPKATDAELYDRPLRFGSIVQRSANPADVRIGDGSTSGGLSLFGGMGLRWPLVAEDAIEMGTHPVRLNGGYSINAEANRFTIWHGTNYALQIIKTDVSSSSNLLSVLARDSNLVFTVASDVDEIVVESCTNLVDAVWENVTVSVIRMTPLIVEVTTSLPALDQFRYYRVRSTINGIGIYVSVPMYVTALGVGGINITSNVVEQWNASWSWINSATGGYALSGAVASLATGKVDAATAAGWETGSHTGLLTKVEAAGTYQLAGSYLTEETDGAWDAWRTNAPAGTTNAILPDGSLVDISGLLAAFSGGISASTATGIAQTVATSYGFAPTGSVQSLASSAASAALASATAEVSPQQLALADGYVTVWSTGHWAQAYTAAPGAVVTVRAVRAAASLTNAVVPIPFWLCAGTNFVTFQTNNLLGFSVAQVATNGTTNLFLLDAMRGSTNFYTTKVR